MAELYIPSMLAPLFPGLPRHVHVDAATVEESIERLDARWPGLRDRILVYVDGVRSELDTGLDERSRVDVIAAISGG
jgi:hypothetical protein